MGERIADVPFAEFGIEPGTAPIVESVVGIGVQRAPAWRADGPASKAALARAISAIPMSSVKKCGAISASPRTR